ncbi:rhomboid family intramembrane serine protease [Wenxinia marina]|uniref:Putative membrane protein n=1 Tax=Wenxinia marina DSM 24838 TaxID=1123501 RepID=A0A0D0Q7K8_9RHOB|nr:rhomboid family intramembrane serine protease [Wenxinia marina]KIQ68447.1 putative membrane protein [Wenxinia marina DSM 24838]GGL72182.1 rhomboid family intramembrane serine protease [Wenxinia marina]
MFPIRDHNPSSRFPFVTVALIAINVVVWLWTVAVFTDDRALWGLYRDYALIPALLSNGEGWLGLVTSTFLHAGFWHLAGNMLFLWIFGDNLEDEFGHVGFLAFYLAVGVAAGLAQWLSERWSPIPTVGASGAIAGVMGAYLLFFPKAKVDVLIILVIIFRIIPVPAWLMLAIWFGIQLLGGFGAQAESGGVAYWAHAGGFVAGFVLALPIWLRLGGPGFWSRTEGHPPHPDATYPASNIPVVRRRR